MASDESGAMKNEVVYSETMEAIINEDSQILEIKPDGGDTWVAIEAPLEAFKESGLKVKMFRAEKTDDGCLSIQILLTP
jgi:hypothetical protein